MDGERRRGDGRCSSGKEWRGGKRGSKQEVHEDMGRKKTVSKGGDLTIVELKLVPRREFRILTLVKVTKICPSTID